MSDQALDQNGHQNGGLRKSDIEMSSVDAESGGHVNPIDVLEGEEKTNHSPRHTPTTGHVKVAPVDDIDEERGPVTEDEVEQRKQAARDRKPLWYCKIITSWPKLTFILTLVGQLLFLLITLILVRTGYDILPITFDRIPLDIRDNTDFLRGLAWDNRNEDDDMIEKKAAQADETEDERTIFGEAVELVFDSRGGNVFTKENLLAMKAVEDEFFNLEEYQSEFCWLNNGGSCNKPTTVIRYFDGSYASVDPVFNDPGFDNIAAVLYEANTNPMTNVGLQYHLGKGSVLTPSSAVSNVTRGYLVIGKPLQGYANSTDNEDEQDKKIETHLFDHFKPIGDKYFKKGVGDMDFVYSSGSLIGATITSQVFKDISLAFGSLLFIVLFMFLQTGSLWITCFSILSIITGFLGANIIYRCILDYRYFGIFHVLALFIILGIGADDVFIFMDTWKETSHHKYISVAHRMSDCYRKASIAMLFTSLTTAQAFIVSATSPFLGISSFGVFAGLLVFVNYISVIVFVPTVVIMYHRNFEKYKCCCCCVKSGYPDDDDAEISGVQTSNGPQANGALPANGAPTANGAPPPYGDPSANGAPPPYGAPPANGAPPHEVNAETGQAEKRKHPVVRFFRGPYFRFITHKVAKWIILVAFAVWTSVFIYFASTLKVNEEQVKFLKDSSNIGKYLVLASSAFTSRGGGRTTMVGMVWGLQEQDLDKCHHTDASCTGRTIWDNSFNLNSDGAQQALLDLCSTIRGLSEEKITELSIQKDLNTGIPEVSCFLDDMGSFMTQEQSLSVPLSSAEVDTIMQNNPLIYTPPLDNAFQDYFTVGASFWLYGGFQGNLGQEQRRVYQDLIGASSTPYTVTKTIPLPPPRNAFSVTYNYGTRLRYVAIVVNTTIESSNLGYPKGLPIRDAWEDFFTEQKETMPDSLKGGFQISIGNNNLWHWLRVQQTLTSSAIIGIAIGLSVAFPILVIATHNIIIGLLATLTICCVTVSVIGVIPLAGWKLGLLESLNLVLIVGLSVDYVVHLAEGYSRSKHHERLGRTRDALEEVGISVLSGATTTLGASFFLLFADILFFTQFGVFMFCTIGFSILFALGLFITLMGVIGPQYETGSLWPLYRWCGRKCCPKKNSGQEA